MSTIYHYTSGDGLLGIISSNTLRATEINFLNDFKEFSHGLEIIENQLSQFSEKIKINNAGINLSSLIGIMKSIITENISNRQNFIVSFTENGDYIRQWMSYGKPNSSYCIGFDKDLLKSHIDDQVNKGILDVAFKIEKVEYTNTPNEKIPEINGIFEKIMSGQKADSNSLIAEFISSQMFNVCRIKTTQFDDEEETRIILQSKKYKASCEQTKFREKGGVIIPFIEVKFPVESIKEIIIGPNINAEMAKRGIHQITRHYGITCDITTSKCSLRQF